MDNDRLLETAAVVFGVAVLDLSDTSSPQDVATWDSLNHLNLVMAIESEFNVTLSSDAMLRIQSLGLAREILREHGVRI